MCKADDNRRGRGHDEVPNRIAAVLAEEGISKDNIFIISDEVAAIDASLAKAKKEDLVMIFGDAITRCWKQIINFNDLKVENSIDAPKPVETVISMLETDEPDPFVLELGQKIVRDERGVRIVAELDEKSD